jgi:hypothetical protein
MYERALAIYREIGNRSQATIALGNVGETLFYQEEVAGRVVLQNSARSDLSTVCAEL